MINEFNYLPLKELRLIKKKYYKHFHSIQKYKLILAIDKNEEIIDEVLAKKLKLRQKDNKNQKIKSVKSSTKFISKRDKIINAILNEVSL
jgi:hypothetical protein